MLKQSLYAGFLVGLFANTVYASTLSDGKELSPETTRLFSPAVVAQREQMTREIERLAKKMPDPQAKRYRDNAYELFHAFIKHKYEPMACMDFLYFYSHLSELGVKWFSSCPLDRLLAYGKTSSHGMVTYLRTFLDYMPEDKKGEAADKLMYLASRFEQHHEGPIAPRLFMHMRDSENSYAVFWEAFRRTLGNKKIKTWKAFVKFMIDMCRHDFREPPSMQITQSKTEKRQETPREEAQKQIMEELLRSSQDSVDGASQTMGLSE